MTLRRLRGIAMLIGLAAVYFWSIMAVVAIIVGMPVLLVYLVVS